MFSENQILMGLFALGRQRAINMNSYSTNNIICKIKKCEEMCIKILYFDFVQLDLIYCASKQFAVNLYNGIRPAKKRYKAIFCESS